MEKSNNKSKGNTVDFRHPFIKIDSNKCDLCLDCIKICKEVVAANALDMKKEGAESFIAPVKGEKLQDTSCESCGLCISVCEAEAITENVSFGNEPVNKAETICNYCSIGCKIKLHHKNNFIMKVTGAEGEINKDSIICKSPRF
ncbi:MAG: hypothetical protein PHD97_04225, partial [Bacteroidales bacterium]|nr:hypothetical protein [Bacteroidales bacterium]